MSKKLLYSLVCLFTLFGCSNDEDEKFNDANAQNPTVENQESDELVNQEPKELSEHDFINNNPNDMTLEELTVFSTEYGLSQSELDEVMSKAMTDDAWESEWEMLDNLVLSIEAEANSNPESALEVITSFRGRIDELVTYYTVTDERLASIQEYQKKFDELSSYAESLME